MVLPEELRQKLERERKYAPFFEWPHRPGKELGVVEHFRRSMLFDGPPIFVNPRPSREDPPDCVVSDHDSREIAVEVTEFVSAEAIRRNQKGHDVYRDWQQAEVLQEIKDILKKKDSRRFHGGPYHKKILLIFTDELILFAQRDEYTTYLSTHDFGSLQELDEVYFMFSYDGARCPYVKLRTSKRLRGE